MYLGIFSPQFLGYIFICNLFPYIIQTAHIYLISNYYCHTICDHRTKLKISNLNYIGK